MYQQSSKFPELHQFLSQIPFPISWDNVITSHPSSYHLYWCIITLIIVLLIRLITYLIAKAIARKLIGYDRYPPLPKNSKISLSSYYLKLGQHVRYKRHIKIHKFSINHLSSTICDNKITTSEIKSWIVACNEFHAKNRLQRRKFQEYLFPILVKSLIFMYGCYSVYDESWIYNHSLFFSGWPNQQNLDKMADIKFLYMFHLSFHLYDIFKFCFIAKLLFFTKVSLKYF